MIIRIESNGFDYAEEEIRLFLEKYSNAEIVSDDADRQIVLTFDESLSESYYVLEGNGQTLTIRGGSRSAVLCGIYEAFGDAGIIFHADGDFVSPRFDPDAFFSDRKTVKPRFRFRGVRQHINFPMDISSYPLETAKEYIRCLARMRFNAITFHSYGGQWHEQGAGSTAGHFFYGQHHPLPDDPAVAKKIDNRAVYCIPAVELLMKDNAARGEYAKYWLGEVMKTAKEAEMEITLSAELFASDFEKNDAMLRSICETYPMIDVLELFSVENQECSKTYTEESLIEEFGTDFLNPDGSIPNMEELTGKYWKLFCGDMEFLRSALKSLETKDVWLAGLAHTPKLRIGIYNTHQEVTKALRPVMRRLLPADMPRSLLPSYGSKPAADAVEHMEADETDFRDTLYYSWAEFDGEMYIQQFGTSGIGRLAAMAPEDSFSVSVNHWRTAENLLTLSYTAETLITPVTTEAFYRKAARILGLPEKGFADTLLHMEAHDTFCREFISPVGFCYYGCWIGHDGLGWLDDCKAEDIIVGAAGYETIAKEFRALLDKAETKEGIALLRLWINRLECSAYHIRALDSLLRLRTDASRESIQKACGEADALVQKYIRHHCERMPDRGCQGVVVSYCVTLPPYVQYIRDYYNGLLDKQKTEAQAADEFDAPPAPETNL